MTPLVGGCGGGGGGRVWGRGESGLGEREMGVMTSLEDGGGGGNGGIGRRNKGGAGEGIGVDVIDEILVTFIAEGIVTSYKNIN